MRSRVPLPRELVETVVDPTQPGSTCGPPARGLVNVITVDDLQRRFGLLTRRRAMALLRRMDHVEDGRDLFTTEGHLAAWLAARVVPGLDRPKAVRYDPLEEAVIQRTILAVRALVERGEFHVGPQLKEHAA